MGSMGDWVTISVERASKLLEQARAQAKNIHERDTKKRRTLQKVEKHCIRGLLAEAVLNVGHEAWADEHWEKAQRNHDDGGKDTFNGDQVKSIDFNRPANHTRVLVSYPSDLRATNFVVVEVDVPIMRGRVVGTFTKADIREFYDGLRGVYVSDLKPV